MNIICLVITSLIGICQFSLSVCECVVVCQEHWRTGRSCYMVRGTTRSLHSQGPDVGLTPANVTYQSRVIFLTTVSWPLNNMPYTPFCCLPSFKSDW